MSVNIGTLDLVIEKTIQTVEESKHQIFEIAEQARSECMHLKAEIESIKNEVLLIIEKGDKLDMRLKKIPVSFIRSKPKFFVVFRRGYQKCV